jgi:hypothetical protein
LLESSRARSSMAIIVTHRTARLAALLPDTHCNIRVPRPSSQQPATNGIDDANDQRTARKS